MSILKNWFGKRGVEVYEADSYDIQNIGDIVIPEKLSNKNAFTLANSVAEIYFPVDFCADRISKLRFFIATKSGREMKNTELNRFVSDINPLFSFGELVYNYIFSLLGDGNAYNHLGVPSLYSNINPSTIERWDVLQPNLISIDEYTNSSLLSVSSINEMIRKVIYNEAGFNRQQLNINQLRINNFGLRRRSNSNVLAEGMLWKVNKSIDTLLAVYSARYNAYANNGCAGYLARKTASGAAGAAFEAAILEDNKRDEILNDINQRNGVTGKKNIWGISGVPIEFVNTLATISELMPFEETLESSIKIASAFQIPAGLVPRKDQSTYNNQEADERKVWENSLLSIAQLTADNLTRMFGLEKIGYKIMFDASNVSALVENESNNQDLLRKKVDNYQILYDKGMIKYNEYLLAIGLEAVAGGDVYIYDMQKTPYATKLGVGGTQALQALIADPNLTPEQKKNTLIVVFGLTDQEAVSLTA